MHVKCIAAVALVTGAVFNFSSLSIGLDSRLPVPTGVVDVVAGVIDVLEGVVGGFACWQVVLVSPLTGAEIWLNLPALVMASQAYSSMGTMVWPSGQMVSESTGYNQEFGVLIGIRGLLTSIAPEMSFHQPVIRSA